MRIEIKKAAPKTAIKLRFAEGSALKFVEKAAGSELQLGYGKSLPLPRRKLVLFLRKIAAAAKQHRLKALTAPWKDIRTLAGEDLSDAALGEVLATALLMADFEFVAYKKEPAEGFPFLNLFHIDGTPSEAQEGIRRGEIIGIEVNACRTLANTPGGDMTPALLAKAAEEAGRSAGAGAKLSLKTLGRKEMQKLGMGAILGMAKGSGEEPRFIIMEYRGAPASKKPLVLIGKGVTFDSGGLNVKQGDSMLEMQMDMSGGAAVIHAIALAAKLRVKSNVIGLIPAIENMSGDKAARPGDILKSLSGRTIEVLNTDAEGRVILADAITYAKRYDPAAVVEASTLTGAILIAIGLQASGLMTKDAELQKQLMELGETSGDYLWPFPQWEEYEDMVKGNFADVANIPTSGNTRWAGVVGGGMFLQEFAKDLSCPFAHLDIASRMTAAPGEYLAKGAAGAPVRLFLALIERHAR